MRPTALLAAILPLALGVALVTRAAAGGDAPPAPEPRPKIAFDRTSHDFGPVKQHAELRTEFTVENRGGASLHVASVRGDCACADATISSSEIAPGGKATIAVVFRTYVFVGPLRKNVHVSCNDPERPETDLEVSVDVSAGIVLEPANFFFDTVVVGTSPTAKVVAKWKEGVGRPFRLTRAEAVGADVRFVSVPFDAPPWHGRTITMLFDKAPPVGNVSGKVLFSTDDPDVPQIQAQLGGTISGRVWLAQRSTSLGLVAYGKGASLEIPCRGFDATVDLGEVTAKSRKGRVEAKAVRDPAKPHEWKIAIRLPPTAAEGAIDDVVEVHTAAPGETLVEIKVAGTVLPKPA